MIILVFFCRQRASDALSADSVGHVALDGVTFCTVDNDLTFAWLQHFGASFPSTGGRDLSILEYEKRLFSVISILQTGSLMLHVACILGKALNAQNRCVSKTTI